MMTDLTLRITTDNRPRLQETKFRTTSQSDSPAGFLKLSRQDQKSGV